jgi:hypothetical protein
MCGKELAHTAIETDSFTGGQLSLIKLLVDAFGIT